MAEILRKRAREKHPGEVKEEEVLVKKIEQEEKELTTLGAAKVELEERAIKISEKEWTPKTELGRDILNNKIINIDQILFDSKTIMEPEIVDRLVPNLDSILLNIGQSKGKFGGGKRSIWRQTQKKTKEGNKPKFAACVVVGNHNGYVGIGYGKAKETMPAREKAVKNAKINLISIKRGCGSWACGCKEQHTIPFSVLGNCGSVRVLLKPAPKGTGLVAESETKKILELAGVKDIYSKIFGQAKTKINLAKACFDALKKLSRTKMQERYIEQLGIKEGQI